MWSAAWNSSTFRQGSWTLQLFPQKSKRKWSPWPRYWGLRTFLWTVNCSPGQGPCVTIPRSVPSTLKAAAQLSFTLLNWISYGNSNHQIGDTLCFFFCSVLSLLPRTSSLSVLGMPCGPKNKIKCHHHYLNFASKMTRFCFSCHLDI